MRPKRKWLRCRVSQISTEDAYLIFNKWRDEQSALQLVMKRPPGLRAVNSAFIKSVLPHSHQVLIAALVDSEYVSVAVNLEGAEYEYMKTQARCCRTLREGSGCAFWPPISRTATDTSSANGRRRRPRLCCGDP